MSTKRVCDQCSQPIPRGLIGPVGYRLERTGALGPNSPWDFCDLAHLSLWIVEGAMASTGDQR